LGEPLEEPKGKVEAWMQCLWERCPERLKHRRELQTLFKDGDRGQLQAARDACLQKLKTVDRDPLPHLDIELLRLTTDNGAYGALLTEAALEELEAVHGQLPDAAREVFAERWFFYLCSSFNHEIKRRDAVFKMFVIDLIRDEHLKTQQVVVD